MLFEILDCPFATLQAQAAAEGAFVPLPPDGNDCLNQTVSRLRELARAYLGSRLGDMTLPQLVEFREQHEAGFAARIVNDLDRRATSLAGRLPRRSIWLGPRDALARFHDDIIGCDLSAEEHAIAPQIVACFKVSTVLPGGNA